MKIIALLIMREVSIPETWAISPGSLDMRWSADIDSPSLVSLPFLIGRLWDLSDARFVAFCFRHSWHGGNFMTC